VEHFERFIQERVYLKNVSPKTTEWYEQSFHWLDNQDPTSTDLKQFVMRMRQAGLNAASCNNRIRAVNAYLHWHAPNASPKCGAGCSHLRVAKLKEPQTLMPVYTLDDIHRVVSWKPQTWYDKRLQILLLTLADIGARIDEALSLKWTDIDFDNLLMTLHGKSSKDRKFRSVSNYGNSYSGLSTSTLWYSPLGTARDGRIATAIGMSGGSACGSV
jgi:integrase/recombinase XerD